MSKSDKNKSSKILLTTPPEEITKIIKRAQTDSLDGIYSSPDRPGITNLLTILAAFENKPISVIEDEVKGQSISSFKDQVAQSIISGLKPIQERYNQVKDNLDWIDRVRREGNSKASEIAGNRINEIKKVVGLSL